MIGYPIDWLMILVVRLLQYLYPWTRAPITRLRNVYMHNIAQHCTTLHNIAQHYATAMSLVSLPPKFLLSYLFFIPSFHPIPSHHHPSAVTPAHPDRTTPMTILSPSQINGPKTTHHFLPFSPFYPIAFVNWSSSPHPPPPVSRALTI